MLSNLEPKGNIQLILSYQSLMRKRPYDLYENDRKIVLLLHRNIFKQVHCIEYSSHLAYQMVECAQLNKRIDFIFKKILVHLKAILAYFRDLLDFLAKTNLNHFRLEY
jgi:hypothetical protein